MKWNKHSFRRFFPSCADRHIEDHRRDPGKNGRVEYPPPPAALFPVPQISPQHRRQNHEDHDPVQRLYIGSI